MPKICLDPGHGGSDSGAVLGKRCEKDNVLRLALAVKPLLEVQGIEVVMTRTIDINPPIEQRCALANDENCNYFLSIHQDGFSNPTACGAGAWVHSRSDSTTVNKAKAVLEAVLMASGMRNRGVCKGTPQSYPDFGVNRDTNMASALLEVGFITNAADNAAYDTCFDKIAAGITRALCGVVGKAYITPIDKPEVPPDVDGLTPITGMAIATAAQMRAYLAGKNPKAPDYAQIYLDEGAAEGIRGDVAFAQSCIETDYWRFGGDVAPEQNNFAGIGATGGGEPGNSFATPCEGIRAQVQHLKAYSNTEPLAGECVDPRFRFVTRGAAPYVEWLGIPDNPDKTGWAGAKGYGAAILRVLSEIVAVQAPDTPTEPPEAETVTYTKEQVAALRTHMEAIQDILGKPVSG